MKADDPNPGASSDWIKMTEPSHLVTVHFLCRVGHKNHRLGVPIKRGVPKELRWPDGEPRGVSGGGGGGCLLPPDLADQVERALRDNLENWRSRGFVEISE
jgi:hypothetical protein